MQTSAVGNKIFNSEGIPYSLILCRDCTNITVSVVDIFHTFTFIIIDSFQESVDRVRLNKKEYLTSPFRIRTAQMKTQRMLEFFLLMTHSCIITVLNTLWASMTVCSSLFRQTITHLNSFQ